MRENKKEIKMNYSNKREIDILSDEFEADKEIILRNIINNGKIEFALSIEAIDKIGKIILDDVGVDKLIAKFDISLDEFELDNKSIFRDTLNDGDIDFRLSEEADDKIIKVILDDEDSKDNFWEKFYEDNAS